VIEDLDAEVGHPHFIDIRKGEAEFQSDFGGIFSD
jgi:hypothetical protein